MSQLNMNELTEGIRQMVLKSRDATLSGVTLDGAVKIQGMFDEIDGICMKIEALMEHPSRYSLANGEVNKDAHRHIADLRRRRATDRIPSHGMDQSFGHRTQTGETGQDQPALRHDD